MPQSRTLGERGFDRDSLQRGDAGRFERVVDADAAGELLDRGHDVVGAGIDHVGCAEVLSQVERHVGRDL